MEQLIVRLGSEPESNVSWLVWSTSESEVIASGVLPNATALNSLTERAGHRPVIALAPSSDIVLKWVDLPPRAGRKILSAIPFMLEDDLSEDIADLFFAFGPKQGDRQAVAVVRHSQMELWQSQLKDAGLTCDKILPDVLSVPLNSDGMSVLTLGEDLLVREDEWKGLQGEEAWITPALAHLTKSQPEPVSVHNYSNIDLSSIPNAHIDAKNIELPMAVLAKEALLAKFNLFQGDYKVRKQTNTVWKQWRVAAVLASVALLVTLVDKGVTLKTLSAENSRIKAEVQQQVSSAFPSARGSRDVKRKITQELAKLQQGGGSASMLSMLSNLAPAFSGSDVKPQSIRFDSARSEVRLQAVASNFESLEKFKRDVEAAGFVVDQGAINKRDEGVVGSLVIRSGV